MQSVQQKRLGAKKVSIVYRRRVADMTALPGEIEGAVAEGIELQTLKAPASIDVDENHHVKRNLCDATDGELDQRRKSKHQTYR